MAAVDKGASVAELEEIIEVSNTVLRRIIKDYKEDVIENV